MSDFMLVRTVDDEYTWSLSPGDAPLIEARRFHEWDIAAIYQIPFRSRFRMGWYPPDGKWNAVLAQSIAQRSIRRRLRAFIRRTPRH